MGFPETFKALSDPVRREILTMLRKGRLSAGDIASHFDMTGATVSYHLKQLKTADLIYETKEKNFIYYSLNTSVFEEILLWVSQFTPDNTEKEVQEFEETEKK
ncbi:MAG: winged helix-turn-helix transcriptional regulator [Ruminococcus sp.]|jgi:DNA-binding transcriptional ArsR family regulator|uniref:autorepressor SdpR family transcription factor n=1 Tax=Ruminococcus sp. TaxID=41978 RepID=UPI001B00BD92|nr:autorepressor SdpR family transcription factor [Ruminococcus sp.]MBO7473152.1 winged helix-turn-helix transcriptional regulator [Ruminococcus sp.]